MIGIRDVNEIRRMLRTYGCLSLFERALTGIEDYSMMEKLRPIVVWPHIMLHVKSKDYFYWHFGKILNHNMSSDFSADSEMIDRLNFVSFELRKYAIHQPEYINLQRHIMRMKKIGVYKGFVQIIYASTHHGPFQCPFNMMEKAVFEKLLNTSIDYDLIGNDISGRIRWFEACQRKMEQANHMLYGTKTFDKCYHKIIVELSRLRLMRRRAQIGFLSRVC